MKQQQKVTDFRTQIYFPADLYFWIKQESRDNNVSMAQVIREIIEEKKQKERFKKSKKNKKKKQENELMELAGGLKGEPSDFSVNMGKYMTEFWKEPQPWEEQ